MCGRASETTDEVELQAYLDSLKVSWQRPHRYAPRWNIAPSTPLIVITEESVGRVARAMHWGFYRAWSSRLLSNARSETVATSKTFAPAFRTTRALVVVDGYYEWRKNPTGPKTPFRIHTPGGGLFTMAALWEPGSPAAPDVDSCTILTAAATDAMISIHNRMPVILDREAALAWINPDTQPEQLQSIIDNSVRDLELSEVSSYVNATRNDGPNCWEKVAA